MRRIIVKLAAFLFAGLVVTMATAWAAAILVYRPPVRALAVGDARRIVVSTDQALAVMADERWYADHLILVRLMGPPSMSAPQSPVAMLNDLTDDVAPRWAHRPIRDRAALFEDQAMTMSVRSIHLAGWGWPRRAMTWGYVHQMPRARGGMVVSEVFDGIHISKRTDPSPGLWGPTTDQWRALPTGVCWSGLIIDTLLFGWLLWAGCFTVKMGRRWRRAARGQCERCGYNRSGDQSRRCPECGFDERRGTGMQR